MRFVLAVDAQGNIFIGETDEGKRIPKFVFTGRGAPQPPLVA